jgi:crossover junction endodeoxyribonuclease RuvC
MLILGLDPGSLHTGFGLVEKRGSELRLIEAGRFSPPRDLELPLRLARLAASVGELLQLARPEVVVVEAPFFGLNARSLIVLAQARGALLATVAQQGIEIREVSPAEVKSAVTGNGRADKAQVAQMVRLLLGVRNAEWPADATDALAVALCGAQRLRLDRLATSQRGPK